MTNEEAIEYNKNLREYMRITDTESEFKFLKENYEALDMGIKALEQEPCDDCISREAVLDMVEDMTDQFGNKHRVVTEGMISLLPPVTPKPKTDVLDKIRAEIHATAELHEDGDYYLRDEWIDEIFDDYKAESEEA